MLDIRSHVLGKWRICCARFKQDWRMIFMLVLGDVVGHGLDPSNGINPLVGILVFLYLLPFFTGLLAGLFFGLAEKVTGDAPTKGNPRSRRKRKSRRNRKSMPNPPSQGNNSSNNNHSSKYKVPSISNSPSKGKALKVPPNFLARFAPEIRLQIFKDYFASFRPQRLYKESHYKEEWSLHLLNALRVCQDQTLYGEALEQYHKSSHFLFDGRSANKVFLESLQPWAVQSIKHITFGPRIIERLMLPNERSTMQWTHDRNDITEEVCRWYLLRSVQIFGRASRLSKAQDLETITVYLPENGQLELELMLFFLISFRTFHKLRKISYCFSATRVSKEGLELTMTKMHAMWQMGRDLEFNMIPWSEGDLAVNMISVGSIGKQRMEEPWRLGLQSIMDEGRP